MIIMPLAAHRSAVEVSENTRFNEMITEDILVRIAKCLDFSPILGNSPAVVEDSIAVITLVNNVALQMHTGTAYAPKYC